MYAICNYIFGQIVFIVYIMLLDIYHHCKKKLLYLKFSSTINLNDIKLTLKNYLNLV